MQTDSSNIRTSPTDMYKERVKSIRNKLPRNWRRILLEREVIYDNDYGRSLINNVFCLQTADVRITEIMEQISKEYVESITKQEVA